MPFVALSGDAVNGARLLLVSGNLADLAMSIPMAPAEWVPGGLIDGSTLFATQILQSSTDADTDDDVPPQST